MTPAAWEAPNDSESLRIGGSRRPAHNYSLYGVRLRSEWLLPCPEETEPGAAGVHMFSEPASLSGNAERRSRGRRWSQYVRLPDGSEYLRWPRLFEFLVSADGRQIACRPLHHASREAFQTYLLGQVLSHALIKQGLEPLHATVVVIGGKAVGFMGDGGYGKSTLAAAFLRAGHPLVTDDLLVIRQGEHDLSAYPGLPRVKVFPDIARGLLRGMANGRPMNALTPKLIIPLDAALSVRAPTLLTAIYVLRRPSAGTQSERIVIRRLSQRRAFVELLKNTYNRDVIEPDRLRNQFALASRVSSEIPIKRLSYPRTLSALPAVRAAILSDLSRFAGPIATP